jgi:ABC-type hemin transport system ATPase subunit
VQDRLVLLRRGAIVADGTPHVVITRENLAAVYGVDLPVETTDGVPGFRYPALSSQA